MSAGTGLLDGPSAVEDTAVADPPESGVEDAGGRRVPATFVFGALAALWGLRIGMAPLSDNSFLTHLATGRLILDTGGIPRVDPYSFTAAGEPWVVQSWLASVAYGLAEDAAGFDGIRLLQGVLCAVLAAAVWTLTARSSSLFVRIGVTGAVLAASVGLWSGRPLLFGLCGLVAVILAAEERLDPRWLVPVGWIWVNTHGSFPFALVLLTLYAVGGRLDRGAWGHEVRILAWAAAGIALGAINPLGPRLLAFPVLITERTEAFREVIEWQPPTFQDPGELLVLGLFLLGVLGLVRAPRWRDAIPLVVFGGMALTAQRNAAPLLLVLTPILAGAAPQLGSLVITLSRRSARVAGAAVAVLALVMTATFLRGPDVELRAYPGETVEWMEEEGLWGEDARVVAYDYVGNLREAQRGAEARVFIDDRVDMYPLDVLHDYVDLMAAAPDWAEILERRGATAVLWEADTPLGGALARDDGWKIVHRHGPWLVAVPA